MCVFFPFQDGKCFNAFYFGVFNNNFAARQKEVSMLVLTRYPGEVIKIADNVEVVVLGVKDKKVRLGFKAPKNVVIDRWEIHQEKLARKNVLNAEEDAIIKTI
jgi:carbon storage regulator